MTKLIGGNSDQKKSDKIFRLNKVLVISLEYQYLKFQDYFSGVKKKKKRWLFKI